MLKTVSQTVSPKFRKAATVACGAAIFIFVAFLLVTNYLAQLDLRESAVGRFKNDVERRASAVNHFFAERRSDLVNLAESRAVAVYFENRALGMSMAYGLRASLLAAGRRFEDLLQHKIYGDLPVYDGLMLVDQDSTWLTGSPDLAPDENLRERIRGEPFPPVEAPVTVFLDGRGIVVSVPVILKEKPVGRIHAWINSRCIFEYQTETTTVSVEMHGVLLLKDRLYFYQREGIKLPPETVVQLEQEPIGEIFESDLAVGESSREMLAFKKAVGRLPLEYIGLAPSEAVYGHTTPWHLPVAMAAICAVLFSGLTFLWRQNTRNLVLRARLEESAKREKEINEKNVSLEREVGERRKIEAALRESELRFRNLVETTSDWFWEVDLQGVYTYVGPQVKDLLGYEPEEVLGKTPYDFMPPEEAQRVAENYGRCAAGRTPFALLENTCIHKNGYNVVFETSGVPIFDADGNFSGYRGTDRDITEKRKLETQLQHAQKMEAIGTLAGGIAHDFNNLLSAIQGNASLLLFDLSAEHPFYENLKNIEKHVMRGSTLTRQLLGYARKGKYEVKPLNLNHLVRETAGAFGRTRKEITIQLDLAAERLAVEADEGQIEQILWNLFVNAADAMPGGGTLGLKTGLVSHRHMRGDLYDPKPGRYVLLSVTDNGVGMDAKTLERIFDPFFTTKEMGRGTGLGLASVYGIVKGHAGYIDVASEKGRGATFNIYLPASSKTIAGKCADNRQPAGGSETILLVDDEEIILNVGVSMLEKLGYTVLQAAGGREAVMTYDRHRQDIQLVILDMIMPEMGGGEAFDRIKEIDPDVVVLLSSGYSLDGQAKQIMSRGCAGFIQKPFGMKELSLKIRQILDREPVSLAG